MFERRSFCATSLVVLAIALLTTPRSLWGQASPWSAGSGGSIYYNGGNVGIGTPNPTASLEMDLGVYGSNLTNLLLRNPLNTWNTVSVFSSYRFIQTTSVAPDGNFKPFNVGPGGVAIGYSATPAYGSAQALYVNGDVGIGTTNPAASLEIDAQGPSGLTALLLQNPQGTWGTIAAFNSYRFVQTASTATDGPFRAFNVGAGGVSIGYPNTPVYGSPNALYVNGNVGIGTINPQYPLSVNGTVQAKEVIVNAGWSDYVFNADYRLRPLEFIAGYIKQNHHLPEIPSEAEVKDKGLSVGEMEAKLLAKVEELTLQMIKLNESNKKLEAEITQLKAQANRGK